MCFLRHSNSFSAPVGTSWNGPASSWFQEGCLLHGRVSFLHNLDTRPRYPLALEELPLVHIQQGGRRNILNKTQRTSSRRDLDHRLRVKSLDQSTLSHQIDLEMLSITYDLASPVSNHVERGFCDWRWHLLESFNLQDRTSTGRAGEVFATQTQRNQVMKSDHFAGINSTQPNDGAGIVGTGSFTSLSLTFHQGHQIFAIFPTHHFLEQANQPLPPSKTFAIICAP